MWVVFFLWATPCEQVAVDTITIESSNSKAMEGGSVFIFDQEGGSVWKIIIKSSNKRRPPSLCWEEDSRRHMHTTAHNIIILHREWGAFCGEPFKVYPTCPFPAGPRSLHFFHLGWEWEFMVYCCWLDTAATAAGEGNGGSDTATKVIGRNTNLFSCFCCYSYGFCLPSRGKVNLQIWKGNH